MATFFPAHSPARTPSDTPPGTPPGPPRDPPGPPGAKFPPSLHGGGFSAPRGPPGGAPRGAPRDPPKWPILALFPFPTNTIGGSWGVGQNGPPGGAKKCTFFVVLNNSPSRDKMGQNGNLGQNGIWDKMGQNGAPLGGSGGVPRAHGLWVPRRPVMVRGDTPSHSPQCQGMTHHLGWRSRGRSHPGWSYVRHKLT